MSRIEIAKIAMDVAKILMDGGEEVDMILNSEETKALVSAVKKLIADIEGE